MADELGSCWVTHDAYSDDERLAGKLLSGDWTAEDELSFQDQHEEG